MSKEKGGETAKKNNKSTTSSQPNEAGSSVTSIVLCEPISPPEFSNSEPQALDLRKNKRSSESNPASIVRQPPPQTPIISENPSQRTPSTASDPKLCGWCKTLIISGECGNYNFCKDTCFESYRRSNYKRRFCCISCGRRGDWPVDDLGLSHDSLENLPERVCNSCAARKPGSMDPDRGRLQPCPPSIIQPNPENSAISTQFPQPIMPNLQTSQPNRIYSPTLVNYQRHPHPQTSRSEAVTSHTVSASQNTTAGVNSQYVIPPGIAPHARVHQPRSCAYELPAQESPHSTSVTQPNSYPLTSPWGSSGNPNQTERLSISLPPTLPRIFGAPGQDAVDFMRYQNTPPQPPLVPERRRHRPSSTVTSDTTPTSHPSSPPPGMQARSPIMVAEARMRTVPTPTGDERRIVVMQNPNALPLPITDANSNLQLMHLCDTQQISEDTPTNQNYNHQLSVQIPQNGALPPIASFSRNYKRARLDEGIEGDRPPPSQSAQPRIRSWSHAPTPHAPYNPGMHMPWHPQDFSPRFTSDGSNSNESCSYGSNEVSPSAPDHRQQSFPNGNNMMESLLRRVESPSTAPPHISLAPPAPPPNDYIFSNILGQYCSTPLPPYRQVSGAGQDQGKLSPGKKEGKASSNKSRRRGRQANVLLMPFHPDPVAMVPETNQRPTSTTVNTTQFIEAATYSQSPRIPDTPNDSHRRESQDAPNEPNGHRNQDAPNNPDRPKYQDAANDPHCSYHQDIPIHSNGPLPIPNVPRSLSESIEASVATVIQGLVETLPHIIPYPVAIPYVFPVNDKMYKIMAEASQAVPSDILHSLTSAVAAFAGSSAALAVASACNSMISNHGISVNQLGNNGTPSPRTSSGEGNMEQPGSTNNGNKRQSKATKSAKEKKSKKISKPNEANMAQAQVSHAINNQVRNGGADSNVANVGVAATVTGGEVVTNAETGAGITANAGTGRGGTFNAGITANAGTGRGGTFNAGITANAGTGRGGTFNAGITANAGTGRVGTFNAGITANAGTGRGGTFNAGITSNAGTGRGVTVNAGTGNGVTGGGVAANEVVVANGTGRGVAANEVVAANGTGGGVAANEVVVANGTGRGVAANEVVAANGTGNNSNGIEANIRGNQNEEKEQEVRLVIIEIETKGDEASRKQ